MTILKCFRFDLQKKQVVAEAIVNLDVKSKYELSGKIMMISVKSNGDASIKLRKLTNDPLIN